MIRRGTLIVVLGLAGSGKSELVRRMICDYCVEENFAAGSNESHSIKDLASHLSRGERCVVAERKYMRKKERDAFIAEVKRLTDPEPNVSYICFENDLCAANRNCETRPLKHGDVGGVAHKRQNEDDAEHFAFPSGAIVMKIRVHQPKQMSAKTPPAIETPNE